MEKAVKTFCVLTLEGGETYVISPDRKQMARWYALDYLKDKTRLTEKGYQAAVSEGFTFRPAFRKRRP